MNLLEILQNKLTEFPEGMLYAVQDDDGEVKFGKHSHPTLNESGIWQRREDGNCLTIIGLRLAEDWDSVIVTKDMWENGRVKQITVNVSGISAEEKQRVNEALEKITGASKLRVINPEAAWFYAPDSLGRNKVSWNLPSTSATSTHTPQQLLEMAGMAKQGHVHADLMAQFAEDAKTTDKPWKLWQTKVNFTDGHKWVSFNSEFHFKDKCEYRRKPKTHTVHGVEIPDLRIVPNEGELYWFPEASTEKLVYSTHYLPTSSYDMHRVSNNLCYERTEEGKQAAILHAKAWLGIV